MQVSATTAGPPTGRCILQAQLDDLLSSDDEPQNADAGSVKATAETPGKTGSAQRDQCADNVVELPARPTADGPADVRSDCRDSPSDSSTYAGVRRHGHKDAPGPLQTDNFVSLPIVARSVCTERTSIYVHSTLQGSSVSPSATGHEARVPAAGQVRGGRKQSVEMGRDASKGVFIPWQMICVMKQEELVFHIGFFF